MLAVPHRPAIKDARRSSPSSAFLGLSNTFPAAVPLPYRPGRLLDAQLFSVSVFQLSTSAVFAFCSLNHHLSTLNLL